MILRAAGLLLVIASVAVGIVWMGSLHSAPRSDAARDGDVAGDEAEVGYPPGPWWREASALNRVVLSGAHIFIGHRDAAASDQWQYLPQRTQTRTRAEALALARRLAREAQRQPTRFEQIARARSEDEATAPLGGSFGVFRGNRVMPELLNALASIEVDHVSRVVETPVGFHVLKRYRVPAEQELAGRQILVKHAGSTGPAAPGRNVDRKRAQAREEAERLAKLAAQHPDQFALLASQHSDGIEAAQGGDLGAFSTYEADADPLVLSVLGGLTLGAVSPVIDTPRGFAVLLRSADIDRPRLAASQIIIGHSGTTEGAWIEGRQSARSREQALTIAEDVLRKSYEQPGSFDALRAKHCDVQWCASVERTWRQGRIDPVLGDAVAPLALGEIAPHVVETAFGFHIVRRDDPATRAPEPSRTDVLLDVPRPSWPPLADYMVQLEADQVATYAAVLKQYVVRSGHLSEREEASVSAIFDALVKGVRSEPKSGWPELLRGSQAALAKEIGSERAGRVQQLIDHWYQISMLGG